MYCPNCGKPIEKGEAFCSFCGARQESNHRKDLHVRTKKPTAAIIAVIGAVLIIAIGIVILSNSSRSGGANQLLREIDAGNYTNAQEIYYTSVRGNTEQERQTSQELKSRLDEAVVNYNDGHMTADEATDIITTIDRSGILSLSEVDSVTARLNSLEASKAAYDSAERLYNDGYFFDAYSSYMNVIEEDSFYTDAQAKAQQSLRMVLDDLDGQLQTLAAAEDYADALDLIESTTAIMGDTSELAGKRTEYSAKYLTSTLAQAESALKTDGYEKSISIITSAIDRIGDDSRLIAALEEYKTYIPVYINELDYFDRSEWGNIHRETDVTDNFGTVYDYGFFISNADGSNGDDMYVTFYLAGKYTTFTGACVLPYELRTETDGNCFKIYGDDVLLFTSNTMTAGAYPQSFEIDLSDVSYLKIVYPYKAKSGISSYIANETATLCDGLLTRTISD